MVFITNNDFMNNYISYEYFLIKLFITISFLITIFNNYFCRRNKFFIIRTITIIPTIRNYSDNKKNCSNNET